jgi:hypothetical protein
MTSTADPGTVPLVGVRAVVFAAFVLFAAPGGASGSTPLGDLNVAGVTLAVDGKGVALVWYTREDGQVRHVLVWGAINALPPSQDVPQVRFHFDYSGGSKSRGRVIADSFRNRCLPYEGPALVFEVAACKAPDGSYRAVQAWYRLVPATDRVDPVSHAAHAHPKLRE